MTDTEILNWLDENIKFGDEGQVCEHSPKRHYVKLCDPKHDRGRHSIRECFHDIIGHKKSDTEMIDWFQEITKEPLPTEPTHDPHEVINWATSPPSSRANDNSTRTPITSTWRNRYKVVINDSATGIGFTVREALVSAIEGTE